jgi:hypothetical protein
MKNKSNVSDNMNKINNANGIAKQMNTSLDGSHE